MTLYEAERFFNTVENRKITCKTTNGYILGLQAGKYFVPKKLELNPDNYCTSKLWGEVHYSDGSIYNDSDFYYIQEGLADSASGIKWELADEEFGIHNVRDLQELKAKVCTCDFHDLMNYGCKCGAFDSEKKR